MEWSQNFILSLPVNLREMFSYGLSSSEKFIGRNGVFADNDILGKRGTSKLPYPTSLISAVHIFHIFLVVITGGALVYVFLLWFCANVRNLFRRKCTDNNLDRNNSSATTLFYTSQNSNGICKARFVTNWGNLSELTSHVHSKSLQVNQCLLTRRSIAFGRIARVYESIKVCFIVSMIWLLRESM